ncbi:hypothetical protein GNP95_25470, partial [Paenibacillus woosongensis]|nr:hypothetical protein [Paenibacillus woosongensis]
MSGGKKDKEGKVKLKQDIQSYHITEMGDQAETEDKHTKEEVKEQTDA